MIKLNIDRFDMIKYCTINKKLPKMGALTLYLEGGVTV